MEGERTFMKNKKLLAKLIFVAILLLIIWYTFKDSAEDIVEQLENTLTVLVAIMAATVIYHLFEAWITYSLARRYNPEIQIPGSSLLCFLLLFLPSVYTGKRFRRGSNCVSGKKGCGIFGSNRTLHDPVHGAQSQRCVVQRTFVRVKLESNVV